MISTILPGHPVTDPTMYATVSRRLHSVIRSRHGRFPGTQPSSFTSRSLIDLEEVDYWVTEKTDGLRVLLYIQGADKDAEHQQTWLIDRKHRFFSLGNSSYRHWRRSNTYLGDTVIDGELVVETLSDSGQRRTCYYAFDCLVVNGEYVAKLAFIARYEKLRRCVEGLQQAPSWCEPPARHPGLLKVMTKSYERAYDLDKVIAKTKGCRVNYCDGMIFTAIESPVYGGRQNKVIKWKPPDRISIDLKFEVTELPSESEDTSSMIQCRLYTWAGGDKHEYFDRLQLSSEDVRTLRATPATIDGRIIEVTWDPKQTRWRPLNIRDDKKHPNHGSVVRDILESIRDGIDLTTLMTKSSTWRAAWEARAVTRDKLRDKGSPGMQEANMVFS